MPAFTSSSISRAENEFAVLFISPYVTVEIKCSRTSRSDTASDVFEPYSSDLVSTNTTSKAAIEHEFIAEIIKPKLLRSIPFLKEQQDLSTMFEPGKVAHYF